MREWIIVTGASSGIGRAISVHFARLNFNLLIVGRNEVELFRTKSLCANSSNVVPVVADLTKGSVADGVVRKLNPTDKVKFLIHCAATSEPFSPLLNVTENQIKESIAVNVIAPLALTKKLMVHFSNETRVLFFGSDYIGAAGKIRENFTGVYSMAKSALDVSIEYLKRENKNLLIGSINPGATNTRMYRSVITAVGLFNNTLQPADPMLVALFVFKILMNTNDLVFTSTKWDFRNEMQRNSLKNENHQAMMQSKL